MPGSVVFQRFAQRIAEQMTDSYGDPGYEEQGVGAQASI
jgi:hypothetical protein